jgi:hypothetical protein
MTRFLLEIPHDSDKVACNRAIRIVLESGSHFLSNADWGCLDGDHRAIMVVDVESRQEAQAILPPALRTDARIVQLNKFAIEPGGRKIRQQGG